MEDQDIQRAREALRKIKLFWCLDDADIKLKRLGGRTNEVFYADHAGEQYVLRLPGKGTEDYINRKNEAQAATLAAKAKVAPDIVFFDGWSGIMITRFVDHGVTMTPENFTSRAGALTRAAEVFKKLHTSGAVFNARFDLFSMIDDYLKILAAKNIVLPVGYADILKSAEAVRKALNANALPQVACHCDPLCENLIDTGKRMWLVDWEYAGMNDPLWDLGHLAVEAELSTAQEDDMLAAYLASPPSALERGRFVIYKAMCDLVWMLRDLIRLANSTPSATRFERCKTLMATAEFSAHVAAVKKG